MPCTAAGNSVDRVLNAKIVFFAAQEGDPSEAGEGCAGAAGAAAADAGVGRGRAGDLRALAVDARLAAHGREHAQPAREPDRQVRAQHVARVPAQAHLQRPLPPLLHKT